ncbi:hypothetical protein KIL84_019707 [Mauremys mutica]|uniref:Uncharacterized protein n=1 Tax=Mauremys mutica TaxID=74926 RepID=A0A9D4BA96_9SAUR|nr:hypothetical protein KIL84_019707 [Mauremys mutica]
MTKGWRKCKQFCSNKMFSIASLDLVGLERSIHDPWGLLRTFFQEFSLVTHFIRAGFHGPAQDSCLPVVKVEMTSSVPHTRHVVSSGRSTLPVREVQGVVQAGTVGFSRAKVRDTLQAVRRA